jgi:hypothetical protein
VEDVVDDHGRSAADVLSDHLRRRRDGDLDGDLRHNYHPEVRLLSAEGIHYGHAGVRTLAGILRTYLPEGGYRYRQKLVCGDLAMLVWSAQTIHYPATPLSEQGEHTHDDEVLA